MARSLLLSFVAALMIAPLLQAQDSQWQNLSQIRPGAKIQVIEQSLKSTSGRFVRFSATDLTFKAENMGGQRQTAR